MILDHYTEHLERHASLIFLTQTTGSKNQNLSFLGKQAMQEFVMNLPEAFANDTKVRMAWTVNGEKSMYPLGGGLNL